jgi:hypothetical protein
MGNNAQNIQPTSTTQSLINVSNVSEAVQGINLVPAKLISTSINSAKN